MRKKCTSILLEEGRGRESTLQAMKLQVSRPEVVSNLTPDEAEEAKKVKVGAIKRATYSGVMGRYRKTYRGFAEATNLHCDTPYSMPSQVQCWCYRLSQDTALHCIKLHHHNSSDDFPADPCGVVSWAVGNHDSRPPPRSLTPS